MHPNSTSNSPKQGNNLHMFIQHQQQHQKQMSNVDPNKSVQANKQNLISQLQNNQNQSMLYRLHQQQVSTHNFNTSGDELTATEKQMKSINSSNGAVNNNLRQGKSGMSQNTSPASKLARMSVNSGNQINKNQVTYNQNRIVKQQVEIDNYYTQQQQYQKAPPIQMSSGRQSNIMPTPQQKSVKSKDGKQVMIAPGANKVGSQERLINYTTQKVNQNEIRRLDSRGTQNIVNSSKDNLTRQSIHKNSQNPQNMKPQQTMPTKGQPQHFIKIKSKTNANPTRQNSPRFQQKASIQPQRNQIRESHGSITSHNLKGQQKSMLQQDNQRLMQSSKGYQVFSQPNSPNKDSIINENTMNDQGRQGYASSLVEPNINVQFVDPNQIQQMNHAMAASVGPSSSMSGTQKQYKKQQMYKNITMDGQNQQYLTEVSSQNVNNNNQRHVKPQSSTNIQFIQGVQNPQKQVVRTTKDPSRQESATNYSSKQRIQSGNSQKNQQAYQNTIRRLNSPGQSLAQANKMAQMSHIENMELQQRKQLNQVVTKNIGGIASGSHRRENRNKMMKMQINNNAPQGSKSVVGSMGSLSQFMGIDPQNGQNDSEYNQMRQMEAENKTTDMQKMQYSQLQHMHLNNVNPMFFSTGEVIQGASSNMMTSFNKNQVVGQVGGTMAIPPKQKYSQNSTGKGGSMISFQNELRKDPNNESNFNIANNNNNQYWINIDPQNQQVTSGNNPTGPVQVKQSMIQMRKINPISKTAANGSQNTSFEKAGKQTQGSTTLKNAGYQTSKVQGRPMPQTTKVSYNNSPQNRSKMQSMATNMPPNRQGHVKQPPMGQPLGDIPLISQYYSFKNQGQKPEHLEGQNYDQKNKNLLAQSVLVRESKSDQRQQSGIPNSAGIKNSQIEQNSNLQNYSQERNKINKASQQLAAGGKLKLKMMSESSSPVMGAQNMKGMPNQPQSQMMNQYFQQNKHKFAQIDSPKDNSIERVRQVDIMGQESMNDVFSNPAEMTLMAKRGITENSGNKDQKGESTSQYGTKNNEKKGESTTQYIMKNIEKKEIIKMSPRSKEVCLIKQLIQDCFKKYNKPPKTQLELYKIGKMLGKGAFGKVNLGLHRLTRKLVAIKSINMDFLKEESQKRKIMNEINILKSLRHPNNIKILETFQTDKHHMIVMELCPGGDLLNYVRKRRKLTEKYAKFVFKQIMQGISYLHNNKVAHRDIKLDNILLDGHGNIKIGDFGVSKKVEENELVFEQCGTPAYIAPEIVKDMGYKGFPVDIWSAGICLYAMLYGNVPFKANQIGDLNTVEQLNQEIEYKKDIVTAPAIDLMKLMLQKVPNKRATAEDVLAHDWLNEEVDEHIDIFDEQELELIRKEFTYVVQKKKLKDFQRQKEDNIKDDLPFQQATRQADDLNTEFTECSIQTHENSLLKNDSVRSVILCPFNTQTGDKNADKIIEASRDLMVDKDLAIRFHQRVRELDRNYEKLNNQDFDNGVYHKYAYKQKGKKPEDKKDELKEEEIRQSDVNMNNLVSEAKAEVLRKRKRENADLNYHNYYVKINQAIIKDTIKLGFPLPYVQKCLKENANNHCSTTYYLLCMDQNF